MGEFITILWIRLMLPKTVGCNFAPKSTYVGLLIIQTQHFPFPGLTFLNFIIFRLLNVSCVFTVYLVMMPNL